MPIIQKHFGDMLTPGPIVMDGDPDPLIGTYDVNCQAAFEGQTQLLATATFSLGGNTQFNGSTSIIAEPSFTLPLDQVNINGSTSLAPFAHLSGEPNHFPEVECFIGENVEIIPRLKQIPFVECKISVDVDAFPLNVTPETYALEMIVDIIPPESSSLNQEWVAELMINGTTIIPIKSYTYSEPASDVGNSLQIDIARISDISALESATSFRFRIGSVVGGVTTWKTFIDNGILSASGYTLTREGNAPFTRFNFTNKSAIQSKLTRSPKRDLVIYDPLTSPVNQDDFEILYDISGNEIITELRPIANLKLHGLLSEVFIGRCGFSGIVTNLPNYPIKRCDISMTETYLSSISGVIGMFEPLIFEYQNKVWVIDTTSALPSGFPMTTEITVSKATVMSLSRNPERLDGYIIVYASDGRDFDFYTTRTETTFEETGSVPLGNYTKTEITRTIHDYRSFSNPSVVIKSEIVRDLRETSNYQGQTVGRTLEEYTYDYFGRQISSVKTQSAYLPQLTGGLRAITDIRQERIEIRYAADPFQPSRHIQEQIWTDVRGLIAVDDQNLQLGEPFKQEYMTAYQSGNLIDSMTTQFGLIKTIRETLHPLTKGQFQVEVVTHDYLLQTVTKETTEPRHGDFSTSALVSRQRQVFLPFGSGTIDGVNSKIRKLYLGEVPLTHGLALATRLLNRANSGQTTGGVEIIGTNFYLRRGLPISTKDQDGNLLINGLVEGFSISGSHRSVMTSIDLLKIG